MALRGGAVSHAIARAGWLVFAMAGVLAMIGVAVLYTANPGARAADNAPAANFVGSMILLAPIGALVGAMIGLPAQFAARSWLRSPTEAERQAARAVPQGHGLRPDGRWARSYEVCARSVDAYHQAVSGLPDVAGRDWLAGIGATLDDELAESLRLARLGEKLELADGRMDETALRVLDRLRAAERSFTETADRAAAIALELRGDSDFVRVRAQLDMLAEQAPQLRASDES